MEESQSFRRSIWVSSVITLVALAVFIGITAVIPRPANNVGVLILGVFLALVPALIWMIFFYQQDRAEPEPKHLVTRMFVFGAIAAAAAAIPIANRIANETISQFPNFFVRLVLTILTVSLIQETLKVAMVRYVVLGTNEFDQHPDGIVYGLASGLGFATILTVAFVIQSDGVIPLAGAIRAVDNTLMHGALGAVSGYYIGRVKLDGKKLGWMASGLAIVTVANGIYQVVTNELAESLTFNPWLSLIAALVIAVVVAGVLFTYFQTAERRAAGELKTISVQIHGRSSTMPWDIHTRYDWLLIGAMVTALVIGWAAGLYVNNRTVNYPANEELSVSFQYPSRWAIQQTGETGTLLIRDLRSPGIFKPTITVIDEKTREDYSLDFVVAQRVTTSEQQHPLYVELRRDEDLTLGSIPAMQIEYKYATETEVGPAVVRALDTYVIVGTRFYIFRYEAGPEVFDAGLEQYERLLRSVDFES